MDPWPLDALWARPCKAPSLNEDQVDPSLVSEAPMLLSQRTVRSHSFAITQPRTGQRIIAKTMYHGWIWALTRAHLFIPNEYTNIAEDFWQQLYMMPEHMEIRRFFIESRLVEITKTMKSKAKFKRIEPARQQQRQNMLMQKPRF